MLKIKILNVYDTQWKQRVNYNILFLLFIHSSFNGPPTSCTISKWTKIAEKYK